MIEFIGPGPFDLPVAHSANAIPEDEHVCVIFRVQIPGREGLDCVRVALLSNESLQFAGRLAKAASEASQRSDRKDTYDTT